MLVAIFSSIFCLHYCARVVQHEGERQALDSLTHDDGSPLGDVTRLIGGGQQQQPERMEPPHAKVQLK